MKSRSKNPLDRHMGDIKRKRQPARLFLIFTILLLISSSVQAGGRGLHVKLRTADSKGNPRLEIIQLYSNSHALIIGIDNYTSGWSPLKMAINDAQQIADSLRKKGFEVTLKADLKADLLRSTLREFFAIKGADPNARLLFWYAGHGHTIRNEGFLVPADAPLPTDPRFKLKALHLRDFAGLMRLAESKHVLSIFDSCFSGTIFTTRSGGAPAAITRKTTKPVRQFITSGDADQVVRDDGSFREYFLRAINGEERADFNSDGYVTGEELGLFMSQQMASLTDAAQTPKTGKLQDVNYNQGDFVFQLPGKALQPAPFVPRVTCPKDTIWNGTGCVATKVSCPPGTLWQGGSCVPMCSDNAVWNGEKCITFDIVGQISDIVEEWGFVTIRLDKGKTVAVGDHLFVRNKDAKIGEVVVKRITGLKVSAVPLNMRVNALDVGMILSKQ